MGGFILKSEQVNRAAVLFVRVRYKHPTTSRFSEDTDGQKLQAALALTTQAAQLKRGKAAAVFHVDWTGLGHRPVAEYENSDLYKVALDANKAELYNKPFVIRVNESFQKLGTKPEFFATDGSGAFLSSEFSVRFERFVFFSMCSFGLLQDMSTLVLFNIT